MNEALVAGEKGWIVPELVVEDVLNLGLGLLTDQVEAGTIDAYAQRMFKNANFDQRQRIVKFFAETDVKVVQNFPQDPTTFPAYVILLTADEQQQYVGDQGGASTFDDGLGAHIAAESWTTTIGIGCMAEHPEVVLWLYTLARWTLASQRRTLGAQFGLMQRLSGRDLGFEKMYQPRFVYRRDLYANLGYIQWDAERRSPVEFDTVDSRIAASETLIRAGLDIDALRGL